MIGPPSEMQKPSARSLPWQNRGSCPRRRFEPLGGSLAGQGPRAWWFVTTPLPSIILVSLPVLLCKFVYKVFIDGAGYWRRGQSCSKPSVDIQGLKRCIYSSRWQWAMSLIWTVDLGVRRWRAVTGPWRWHCRTTKYVIQYGKKISSYGKHLLRYGK